MTHGKWCKMGIKSMRNSSMESPPIFISKWKNIGKTFYSIFLKKDGLQEPDLSSGVDYVRGRFGA